MSIYQRIATVTLAGVLALTAAGVAFSEDDDDDDDAGKNAPISTLAPGAGERGGHKNGGDKNGHSGWIKPRPEVAPVNNATYGQECGGCHLAYQPAFLPAAAWTRIMEPTALADHYGDDASLSEALRTEITNYLSANAANQIGQKNAAAFTVENGKDANQINALPRITTTRYFTRKHDEIPARLVANNPEVGSFSQCNTCHRGAADGVYNEVAT